MHFFLACYHSDITRDSPNFDPENLDLEKYPPNTAVTIELCAGIVDKNKSLVEIAQEEILEECGYYVPADRIQQIKQYRYLKKKILHILVMLGIINQ